MKDKTIYERIQLLREEIAGMNLKKTGDNQHMRFTYFELSDFLPQVTKLCVKYGLSPTLQFNDTSVHLMVFGSYETDKGVWVAYTVPRVSTKIDECKTKDGRVLMKSAQLMGMDISYYRRYLYMIFADLCEPDGLDAMKQGEQYGDDKF